MDTLGIDTTPEELDLMITEIDQDSNGEIDFEGTLMNRVRSIDSQNLSQSCQEKSQPLTPRTK